MDHICGFASDERKQGYLTNDQTQLSNLPLLNLNAVFHQNLSSSFLRYRTHTPNTEPLKQIT